MGSLRGTDRRQSVLARPGGLPDRRCGVERRKFQLTEETIIQLETRLAALAPDEETSDDGSGWDKRIVPLK